MDFSHFLIKTQEQSSFTVLDILLQCSKWELLNKLVSNNKIDIVPENYFKMEYAISIVHYLYKKYNIKTGRHLFIQKYATCLKRSEMFHRATKNTVKTSRVNL